MTNHGSASAPAFEVQDGDQQSIATMTTQSRHSSVHGPYGRDSIPQGNGFPIFNLVSSAFGSAESYSRSLLSSGNGYPIFDVIGDWKRSSLHITRGPSIGDVGVLCHEGNFIFAFNIFALPNDPVHANETPPNFQPMKSPEQSDVTKQSDYFPPGTVIASKGITVNHISDPSPGFTISTSVREGGILVLPDGASREDFAPSPSLLKYIEDNALDWYLYVMKNLRGEAEAFPNGSLYLITGCDKTRSVSCVAIPIGSGTSGHQVELQYKQGNEGQPWSSNRRARICRVDAESNPGASYGVFLRGIRIALSSRSWSLNMEVTEPDMKPYYSILSKTATGRWERILRSVGSRLGLGPTLVYNRPEVPFHVSDIIAQLVLKDSPSAEVTIVEDHVWISCVDSVLGDGTLPEIMKLLVRVLSAHDVVMLEKTARLVSKSQEDSNAKSGLLRYLLTNIRLSLERWKLEQRIKRVLKER